MRAYSGDPFGSWLDRELVDLALSVNNAALWSFWFAQNSVTWVSDGMDALLDMPGASDPEVRARLDDVVAPLVETARSSSLWHDLELHDSLTGPGGKQHRVSLRARRVGEGEAERLIGLITGEHEPLDEQDTLADLANRYRLLVELSPDAIAVHQGGKVKYVNPATVTLFGAESPADFLERPLTEFVDESSIAQMRSRLDALSTTGDATPAREAELDRFDGSVVPVEVVSVRTSWEGRLAFQVIMRDLTTQRQAEATLRYQASHDDLTGLLNRKGINEVLADLVPATEGQLGVVFCDIDNFKRINDAAGHQAGDEVLATLAQRLQDQLPEACTAGRLSGDEFVIICSDIPAVGGLQALLEWVSAFMRTTVPVRGHLVHLSASTGAAILEESMAGQDLLRYADAAMFQAKGKGPGRVMMATTDFLGSADGQLAFEDQLRAAIDNDQLCLHYQPITHRDGTIIMAEALLRWPHPTRGLLSPGVILPAAEQAGILTDLDQWVLRTALREATQWPGCHDNSVTVTVNLAALTPDEPGFAENILTLLATSALDPHRLVLEMVETTLVELTDRSQKALTTLARHGVRFALDDFGTGYSSLARLKALPIHLIKIDKQFVAGITTDPSDYAICRAAVDLATAMGRDCIAEGVETPQQLKLLNDLNMDLFQGYLFSHPLPANELDL